MSAKTLTVSSHMNEVERWTKEKKWWKDGRTVGDDIALIHSELSEALEAYRDYHSTTIVRYEYRNGELRSVSENEEHEKGKPVGVPTEIADVYIRLLHFCAEHGIDLAEEFKRKMDYNWTRTERHGGKAL